MLNPKEMKENAKNYTINFDIMAKEIYIVKGRNINWIQISNDRALEWIEAGIEDLDCRTREAMIELVEIFKKEGGK